MDCCCKEEHASKKDRQCCVCNPFDQDPFLLTAQICSILTACLSWFWWPCFILSFPVVTIYQTAWCCKMKKCGFIAGGILSALAFVCSLIIGILMLIKCWDSIFVIEFGIDDGYGYYDSDGSYHFIRTCYPKDNPKAWPAVAFVTAILYLTTSVSTWYFVGYRYDTVARQWADSRDAGDRDEQIVDVPAIEMAVATAISAPLDNEKIV